MKNSLIILFLLSSFVLAQNTSSNVVLLPSDKEPTISIKIMFYAGSRFDPAGKEGLSALTAAMLSDGSTKNNSYQKILEKLYPLAASYDAHSSIEVVTFEGRVHKDNLQLYYPLFMDALLRPAFSEDDFNRIKSNMINYLTTMLLYSSDEELGKAVLYNDIFEGTPYGHLISGTVSGLNNITLDDLKEFYGKYYNKHNYILGIGGGYDKSLVKKVESDLNSLPDGKKGDMDKIKASVLNGNHITIVEKPANATAISLGFPINVLRGNKDWYALAIANSWLGEHRNSSSHLYQVIREARGLNYGDYSYIENFPNGGRLTMPPVNVPRTQQIFEIWIRPVPNETRHFALRAAIRELHKLIDNGMSMADFTLTKNFLSKYVKHYAPSTDQRLGYMLDDVFYNVKGSHLTLFDKYLNELTLDDVNSAIKKYLHKDDLQIAVITHDAETLKKSLVSNEISPINYATPKPDSVLKEDEEIIKFIIPVKEENIRVVDVKELFK